MVNFELRCRSLKECSLACLHLMELSLLLEGELVLLLDKEVDEVGFDEALALFDVQNHVTGVVLEGEGGHEDEAIKRQLKNELAVPLFNELMQLIHLGCQLKQ